MLLDMCEVFWLSSPLNESHCGAYVGSKSNRAIGEKTVRKSNNVGSTGAAPLLT
jgi:hypothetical protein